jgi:hypothetical protein
MKQRLSVFETTWRREVNSNCWYAFCTDLIQLLRFSSSASGRGQRRGNVLSAANLWAVIKECRFLPCEQSFNFLFAACPNFVPANCAWLLSTRLIDNDKRAVIGLYYGANLLEVNQGADNRAVSGVVGKAEVLVDKAKLFLAKCFFKTTLPAGPIPHQIPSLAAISITLDRPTH